MKRKEEHIEFKRNLRILTEYISDKEKEKAKSKLFELYRKDAPFILTIIRNGYFFDKKGERIENKRLINIVNSDLCGYEIPSYIETIKLVKEKTY